MLSLLLATGIHLLSAATVPPDFDRSADGSATDGQRVVQPAGTRRQVVAIVPDRTTGRDWGLRYLSEAVEDLNRTSPDAVFCVGDLVQGYSRSHAHVRGERDDFLRIVDGLRMPFYPTPGNHDLVSGKRDPRDRSFADEYRARFGPLYYAVELELASFVILNTEDGDGRIEPGFSDGQLAWLDATLGALEARGKPIILLFHRPLWDHKPTRWDERVQPLLVKHGVDYVIAGHYHALQALPPRDGIPYLLLGTCGGAIDQHPLAGQLQHISFLVIGEDGVIAPYYQVVGCTLPVDWIAKSDQDLAYRMKSSRDAVKIEGSVPDALHRATEGSIVATLSNPLDRAVEFVFAPASGPTAWEVTDRTDAGEITRVWTSRTAFDIFNPATTDLSSPARLALPPMPITLEPGATTRVAIPVAAPPQITPLEPIPFEIVATYSDGKGRRVPIRLRQRVPIARTISLAADRGDAVPYSIAVWQWSEYDTPEANATARFTAGGAGTPFIVSLEVPDSVRSALARPAEGKSGLADPLGDAVRLVLGTGPEAREYLVTLGGEPSADEGSVAGATTPVVRALSPDKKRLDPTDAVAATLLANDARWVLELRVSEGALPRGAALDGLPVNIGVADNDETYHTQWRWLAPADEPARLRVSGKGT